MYSQYWEIIFRIFSCSEHGTGRGKDDSLGWGGRIFTCHRVGKAKISHFVCKGVGVFSPGSSHAQTLMPIFLEMYALFVGMSMYLKPMGMNCSIIYIKIGIPNHQFVTHGLEIWKNR